jgi:ABC-type lipoprotein export system ATPase subunit
LPGRRKPLNWHAFRQLRRENNRPEMQMLAIENVKKSYREPDGTRLAILDVPWLAVAAGEQVVIRGRSGGGKTTLLNIIAGLATPDEGRVVIQGTDISGLPEFARDRFRARHIGFVFQTFNLLDGFSALENVLLGMTFTGQTTDSNRATELLKRVGLGHRLTHKPGALSVGEQQRVAVARALVNRPVLLLADEPTANIDPAHQQQVVDLLRGVCRDENVAMLLVTHSPEVSGQFERVEHLDTLNRVMATVHP